MVREPPAESSAGLVAGLRLASQLAPPVSSAEVKHQADQSSRVCDNYGPKRTLTQQRSQIPIRAGSLEQHDSTPCLRALDFDQEVSEFLFAFGLVLAGLRFGQLSDIHRAEFRAAHRAEFRFLVKIIWQRFIVHGFRGFRIE